MIVVLDGMGSESFVVVVADVDIGGVDTPWTSFAWQMPWTIASPSNAYGKDSPWSFHRASKSTNIVDGASPHNDDAFYVTFCVMNRGDVQIY